MPLVPFIQPVVTMNFTLQIHPEAQGCEERKQNSSPRTLQLGLVPANDAAPVLDHTCAQLRWQP